MVPPERRQDRVRYKIKVGSRIPYESHTLHLNDAGFVYCLRVAMLMALPSFRAHVSAWASVFFGLLVDALRVP